MAAKKYVQKHRNTGYHVDAYELANRDAETQAAQRKTSADYSEEVLADIDEALEGLDEMLGVKFRQQGGQ